ncbi:LOW QUALITY PROTEIN: RUN and SH3 domain-containing protein 1-like [Trichoplusia ni]|uniref:LOW QUALITY PROTEIN: RUN and SH3 domain-containing protein 1-like n=1 Tax=Trichoplusia ni TaxID=7111 RepID=A0A7E5WZY1_TRINI|nr:LOW QUALITY PROTEIN: RUN and SH3 domain-containing protein 1-like [Trichoplusia ni]
MSCDCNNLAGNTTAVSSSSSTATQPSSGYRGSSTMLTDSSARIAQHQLFLDAAEKDADYNEYYPDEGVGTESSLESGKSNELKFHRPHTPPLPKPRTKKMEYTEFPPPGALISSADLQQLERIPKAQNLKATRADGQPSQLKPTEEIKASLTTPPNSPNISAVIAQRLYQGKNLAEIPICEEAEVSPDEFGSPIRHDTRAKYDVIDVSQREVILMKCLTKSLVSNVTDAVEMLIQHFSSATDQAELAFLGDSKDSPACAKIALNALCPALYAIFRDGLKENIETSFGAVNNSVWQMVEATARQGPITKSLNELVLRINSEDAVTEGLVKFNAFILGLLNAQSVDAWVSYVRTRESVLAKHYSPDSLILAGCVGETRCRALLDTLLASLEPLKLLPFSLDLMFEMRELHRSFRRLKATCVPPVGPLRLTLHH